MTLQRIVEELGAQLPNVSRTRLIYDINQALYEFSQDTGVIVQRVALTSADYVGENTVDEYFEYNVPADLYEIIDVNEPFQGNYEVYNGVLRFLFYPPDSTIHPVIHYKRLPSALVNLTDIPDIPVQLHGALVSAVLINYWSRDPQKLNLVGAERFIYAEFVRKGLRMASTFRHRNLAAVAATGGTTSGTANNVGYGIVTLQGGVPATISFDLTYDNITYSLGLFPNPRGVLVEETDDKANRTTSSAEVVAVDDCTCEYIVAGLITA